MSETIDISTLNILKSTQGDCYIKFPRWLLVMYLKCIRCSSVIGPLYLNTESEHFFSGTVSILKPVERRPSSEPLVFLIDLNWIYIFLLFGYCLVTSFLTTQVRCLKWYLYVLGNVLVQFKSNSYNSEIRTDHNHPSCPVLTFFTGRLKSDFHSCMKHVFKWKISKPT